MTNAWFRTKSGFRLEAAGVLPTKPVQTASAATPAIAPISSPRSGFPGIPAVPSGPAIAQPAATGKPPRTDPLRKRQASRADGHGRSARRSHPSREKHVTRISSSLQTTLVGSILLVGIMAVFSAMWWMGNDRGAPAIAGFFSQPATALPAEKISNKASLFIQDNPTPTVEPRPNGGAAIPQEAASAVTQTPKPAPAIPEQALAKMPQTPSDTTAAPASRQMTSKKIAKIEPIPRTMKRTVAARKKQRIDEISRLQTQAFSETKKDRLGSGKHGAGKPPPSYRFDQQSMQRNSYDTNRADKRAGRLRNAFNACERSAGFIQREQCKWRVCGGKWGQNGCPSYKREDPTTY